ncbi:MAG: hypothetical protein FJ009_21620 [Chloroflexi bacterium]|nr:hypothetical protein [Chloroflexota bacterium]
MVRGGSFNNNENNVRCAYRNRNNPDNYNRNQGVRVVLSHVFLVCRKCDGLPGQPHRVAPTICRRGAKNGSTCSCPRSRKRAGQI